MSESETETAPESPQERLMSPSKIVLQLVGFAVGVGLLVWIIVGAIGEGHWDRLRDAHPGLVALLIGSTAVSVTLNALIFHSTIRAIKPIKFWDLQRVNIACNMLNYAPVRVGVVMRFLYHMRVDGLTFVQVGAWFSFIGAILMICVAACVVATLIRTELDALWLGLVIAQVGLAVGALGLFASHPLIRKYGRGIERLATDRVSLWSCAAIRLVDLGAFTTRMAVAAAILQIELPLSHMVVLAVVALGAGLLPFGRVGFREFLVAAAAERLSLMASDIEQNMKQLALIESAGEAAFMIPVGIALTWWMRKKWIAAGADTDTASGHG